MEQETTSKHLTELDELGEFGLIDQLTQDFPLRNASSLKGVGDDAAVINHEGYRTLVSVDMLIEGIHFDMTYCPLKHLGYKAAVSNFPHRIKMKRRQKNPSFVCLTING